MTLCSLNLTFLCYMSQSAADGKLKLVFILGSDVLHFYCMLFLFMRHHTAAHLAQVDAGKGGGGAEGREGDAREIATAEQRRLGLGGLCGRR